MTLTYKYHLKSLQPSDHRHTVSEVKARLDQSERRHSPDERAEDETDGQTYHYRAPAERNAN